MHLDRYEKYHKTETNMPPFSFLAPMTPFSSGFITVRTSHFEYESAHDLRNN